MKRVLYIEDNEDIALAVRSMLNNAGYETTVKLTGTEGIEECRNRYDLILIDIMLPDISGWELFSKIKGKAGTKYAFISAIPVSGERLNSLKRDGIAGYITKPFTKKELITKIKSILR